MKSIFVTSNVGTGAFKRLCRDRLYITYKDTAEQNNTNKKGTVCRRETVKEDS